MNTASFSFIPYWAAKHLLSRHARLATAILAVLLLVMVSFSNGTLLRFKLSFFLPSNLVFSGYYSSYLDVSRWKTYVISLPNRGDRMQDMKIIRDILGMANWHVIPATPADDEIIDRIISLVRTERQNRSRVPFTWPSETDMVDTMFSTQGEPWSELEEYTRHHPLARPSPSLLSQPNMSVAWMNERIPMYQPHLPDHKMLTRGKIACWRSHIQTLKQIASESYTNHHDNGPSLVLEDDVDVERNFLHLIEDIWPSLPPEWDMVFLGHCWSDESANPALPRHIWMRFSGTAAHPSNAPLCTHAYAVNRRSARKLLLYLQYTRFAYSRALDHAYAHLITEGLIQAISLVPSIAVQRKALGSDVRLDGVGSTWHDGLIDGVFGTK